MWNLIKRIYHFITTVLFYSIMVILVLVGIAVLLYFADQKMAASKGERRSPLFGAYVIVTNSMVPNINVDDAVITMRTDPAKIKKGDVITFISTDTSHAGITITHRVIGINVNDVGEIAFKTKGDHNNVEDRTLVSTNNVLGKVMLRIPYVGKLQKILTTTYGWILLIIVPCVLMIGSDIIKMFRKTEEENPKKEDNKKEIKTKPIEQIPNEQPIKEESNLEQSNINNVIDENIDNQPIQHKKIIEKVIYVDEDELDNISDVDDFLE